MNPLPTPNLVPILELIPQRPPMVMVDALLEWTETDAMTRFEVLPSNIFCQNGHLEPTALMENIAQTAAAHAGYYARSRQVPPAVGFIGAIKGFKLYQQPKIGDVLHTKLSIVSNVLNFSIIQGTVWCGETLLAEAELKIFLQNTPSE